MKEYCNNCCCCNVYKRTNSRNFYNEYLEKAKDYVKEKNIEFPLWWCIFNDCNAITREIYRRLEPERYKPYKKIYDAVVCEDDVFNLLDIFQKFADTYIEILLERE